MIAASAILRPIRDVSIDYKDDTSVSSTARTVKASNHDPRLLAHRKKMSAPSSLSGEQRLTEGQMDAFRALQPCLIESRRGTLSRTFPTREMTLDAHRQDRLVAVEALLLSPRFSTCSEQVVAVFMSVLADLSFNQMHEMQELVAGRQIMPPNVDLASHDNSSLSSITDSTPCNPPFPRRSSRPAEVALMEGLLFDGLLDQDARANTDLLSHTPLNQDGRVNTGGNASTDATHGSASVAESSSSFSATEPSLGDLDLYDTQSE